ncbi:AAA domain-containing protein [Streptomyces sp. NPDC092307]|uniref:AAA domain-containing protein n=1 Tax=Streptomyces sp. NPDC092307 TaxID=3366013 RepID=UPI003811D85D
MYDELPPNHIDDLVADLFTGAQSRYGRYQRVTADQELIKGRLVRLVLRNRDHPTDVREVALFLNVDPVGGDLWRHEVRNLLRLKMLGHPALPEILEGSFDSNFQAAFIMTRLEGKPLAESWRSVVDEWAVQEPVVAFEQFGLLVDALSQLHGTRIVHRNLTLGAIRFNPVEGNPARTTLALARFELSALLNNLLRSVHGPSGKATYDATVNALFATPPPGVTKAHHLAYLAPEKYPVVFCDVRLRNLDHGSTDTFGLGVLGWEFFVGSLVDRLPQECAAVERAEGAELPPALERLHRAMRTELDLSRKVPRPLRKALLDMLDPSPTQRSTSFEASAALQRDWSNICLALQPTPSGAETPRLLAFMPDQSVGTIYRTRGWTDHSPDTPEGCEELKAFLEEELREAELVHWYGGAVGFVDGDSRSLGDAQWVLIGQQAVWFCAFLFEIDAMGRRQSTYTDTLVIKYLVDKRFASEIVSVKPKRRIGKVDLVPFQLGQPLEDEQKGRPSWEALTDSVRSTEQSAQSADVQEMLRAVSFMLEYQGVVLRSRQYPYSLSKADDGSLVLTQDRGRELRWLHEDELLTAYCSNPRRRPPLGDFARNLSAESRTATLSVVYDRSNPYFGKDSIDVRIKKRLDATSIVVEVLPGTELPAKGWLRPREDHGTETQLKREARGLGSLRQKSGLARILHTPRSIELTGHRETTLHIPPLPGERPLRGKAVPVIEDMLRLHPFYALQGPPGTGKSTVVSHALRDFLRTEHGARVLVSAQSNDALNELAKKCLKLLKPAIDKQAVLMLRELPRRKDAFDLPEALRAFTAEALTENLVKRIRRRVEDGHVGARNPAEQALMLRWYNVADANKLELTERIRAGADIVLATCSIAGSLTDEERDPSDVFDWVIIEEAAKAWPTEIIMPLVLGVRWTLVGDHLQLGPHRAEDIRTFLDGLEHHPDEQIKLHYAARESYLRFVQLFARFFEGSGATPRRTGPTSPMDTLDTQFRMHPVIAEPFSRAFYPDGSGGTFLLADPQIDEVHSVVEPAYVAGAPLVWLDTSEHTECGDSGYWWNRGEVELIEDLVRKLGLETGSDPKKLAVLTPYREQLKKLERGFLKGRAHTVHSFQGGQAKTVIASLVRSTERGTEARQNVGHTAQADVINVMLSRAQELLVVVGNLPHFERYGGAAWQSVIETFRQVGRVVDAATGKILSDAAVVTGDSR